MTTPSAAKFASKFNENSVSKMPNFELILEFYRSASEIASA